MKLVGGIAGFRVFARVAICGALLAVVFGCSTTAVPTETVVPVSEPRIDATTLTLPDVPLGAGDEVDVLVYREAELARTIRIPRSGVIFFPLVGEMQAKGLTANEVRRRIAEGLSPYLVDPQVSVEVTAHRSQKVVVMGEVKNPGIFTIETPITTLEAIAMAGGFQTSTADRGKVVIAHQRPGSVSTEVVALNPAVEGGLRYNPGLQAGDVVYVPAQTVVNWARYARNLENVLRPILLFEQGVLLGFDIDLALRGKRQSTTTIVLPGQQPQP